MKKIFWGCWIGGLLGVVSVQAQPSEIDPSFQSVGQSRVVPGSSGTLVFSVFFQYGMKKQPQPQIDYIDYISVPYRLSPRFYTTHWGYFCQLEWQLEKTIRLPLRFRLGSAEYTNHLEEKGR